MRRLRLALLVLGLLGTVAPRGALGEATIVALGDSLTAGAGVTREEAWPAVLEAHLREARYPYRVVNAGVSGDTSAGGVRRVGWVLRAEPEVTIVALGANDGLRGQSVAAMAQNLETIVRRLRQAGTRVLLAGMRVPPNYGDDYSRAFADAFPLVARRTEVALIPFLLEGVAADPRLNLADGIHPNPAGHRVIAALVLRFLKPMLEPEGRSR
jgi:acyl-CoA thioesterase-1